MEQSIVTVGKTIADIRRGLKNKEFSCAEITREYLNRIEKYKSLNAYVLVTDDLAMKRAKEIDAKIANGGCDDLLGVPLAIKDLYCTKNIRTTSCSKILSNFVPQYESTVTQNLLDAGAVFLGKTNMDELAMGSSNTTSYFGNCYLPYRASDAIDDPVCPGGSSGGSAAATVSDLCVASTGSDTGGSIRQPSAFAGLVGIKPTYGLCSRYGMIAFASSLDQAGPITKNVEDAAIMLKVMAGYDPNDSTSLNVDIPDYTSYIGKSVRNIRIGIVDEYLKMLDQENIQMIEKAKKILQDLGCQLVNINLKSMSYSLPVYYIIAPAEASSNLARLDGVRYGYRAENATNIEDMYIKTRSDGFGEEVQRRILAGTYILSSGHYDAYYMRALKIRQIICNDFRDNAFTKVDAVLTPTTTGTAFSIKQSQSMTTIQMYLSDIFTVTANVAGLPAIALPVGLSSNMLPMSVQFIGNKLNEALLFQIASAFESSVNFEADRKKIHSIL